MNEQADPNTEGWSYFTWRVKNQHLNTVTQGLNALGRDGWELVSSVSTVKTWINLTGNDIVFVFRKRGVGRSPSADLRKTMAGGGTIFYDKFEENGTSTK